MSTKRRTTPPHVADSKKASDVLSQSPNHAPRDVHENGGAVMPAVENGTVSSEDAVQLKASLTAETASRVEECANVSVAPQVDVQTALHGAPREEIHAAFIKHAPSQTPPSTILDTINTDGAGSGTQEAEDSPKSSESQEKQASDDALLLLAADILEKQYRVYAWSDGRMQGLVTANSILFAAVGFLFPVCLDDCLSMLFLGLAVAMLSVSLMLCVANMVPVLYSGKSGPNNNLRAISGILVHKTVENYSAEFQKLSEKKILDLTLRQLYGMASNSNKGHAKLIWAIRINMGAVSFLILSMISVSLSVRGTHWMGTWRVKQEEKVTERSTSTAPKVNVSAATTNEAKVDAARSRKDIVVHSSVSEVQTTHKVAGKSAVAGGKPK